MKKIALLVILTIFSISLLTSCEKKKTCKCDFIDTTNTIPTTSQTYHDVDGDCSELEQASNSIIKVVCWEQ